MRYTLFTLAVLSLCLVSCGEDGVGEDLASSSGFELLGSDRTGISFVGDIKEDPSRNYFLFNYIYIGGGLAAADFNNDGLEDLYIVSNSDSSHLYINEGDFRFRNVTAGSNTHLAGLLKTGVTIVDINQDGLPDIYQCVTGELTSDRKNRLLVNNGDLTFTDRAAEYGLALENPSTSAAFFDYDRDGDLDAYVINRPVDYSQNDKVKLEEVDGKVQRITKPQDPLESDALLANINGKYQNVSALAGIQNRAFSLSLAVSDFNEDGWPDVYVANDYIEPDLLYINQKDGTFSEEADAWFEHMPHFSMGSDVGDLNGDGKDELLTLDMLSDDHFRQMTNATVMDYRRYSTLLGYGYGKQVMRNMLQTSNGNGTFSEVACFADVYKTDWSWGPLFFDYDNDGRKDIFISNGFMRDVSDLDFTRYTMDSLKQSGLSLSNVMTALNLMPSKKQSNYLYRNEGGLNFENVAGIEGVSQPTFSNGSIYADFNNDGRLDLAVHNNQDPVFVYANRTKGGHHVQVQLEGKKGNLDAVGAKVSVYCEGQAYTARAQPTRGFMSAQSQVLHIGLGDKTKIDRVLVDWPDGTTSSFGGVQIDQLFVAKQTESIVAINSQKVASNGVLGVGVPLSLKHNENPFEHFEEAPLLYRSFAAEGPVTAVGDVNGDQLDDIYFGASLGFGGSLAYQQKDGSFRYEAKPFAADKIHEDGAAHFFDADQDGDLDLYIGSSGVANHGEAASLQDRLYINENGSFKKRSGKLPTKKYHTSAVASLDVDQDGDLDLVVAHFGNLNNYPGQEPNEVYVNEGGSFIQGQEALLKGWKDMGMVQALLVADLQGNGQQSLVAAGEWTPISVFEPIDGAYEIISTDNGLSTSSGLWFSLAAIDADGDGDQDIIAGNLGLNTRFEASVESPLVLTGIDLDNNNQKDPVIFGKKGTDKYWPYARREELTKQVPAFAKTYTRFASYARADMNAILGEKASRSFPKVEHLDSKLLVNEGGIFRMESLPDEVQYSAVRGITVLDVNADGVEDAVCVGNVYDMEMHGGSLDAGAGVVLLGSRKAPLSSVASRGEFYAQGDTRSAHVVKGEGSPQILVTRNKGAASVHRVLK
ncbi:MAG: VCBS repeat-containing protein [Saprospiraceae bacterium]